MGKWSLWAFAMLGIVMTSESVEVCEEPEIFSATEFLPPYECVGKLDHRAEQLDSCKRRLLEVLQKKQEGTPCSEVVAAGFMNYGLGSTFNYMIVQMHRSLRDNKSIAFVGEWVYAGCEHRNFSCAFDPVSPCDLRGAPLFYPRMVPDKTPWDIDQGFASCFQGRPNLLFHFVSTIAGFLFRPNQEMQEAARAVRQRIGLPDLYLGIHIRHGDFCVAHTVTSDPKECFSVSHFAQELQRLSDRYNITHVYLATDNSEALEMIRSLCPQLTFYWQDEVDREFLELKDRDFEIRRIFVEERLFDSDIERRQKHLREIMIDLMILSQSFGFVGQFSSNISKILLAVGTFLRGGKIIPYISLDIPWCWNGMNPTAIPGYDSLWQC